MRLSVLASITFALAAAINAPAGTVSTFAGTGVKGFSGDGGPAAAAQLNNPFGLGRAPDGALYICDTDNQRIRRVSAEGTISTFAGCGVRGLAGDGGQAIAAELNEPYELAWDGAGNLFFVERMNHAVRRVDAKSGIITTVAGNGRAGFAGDGGPARGAQFNQPHSLAFDGSGYLYICDVVNHRVRRIDFSTGLISTWCGTGEKKTARDDSPIAGAALHGPRAITFDGDGRGWLALREGNSVVRLDPRVGILRRVAGTGISGFTGNGGPAREATLSGPKGVSLDESATYFADTESHSIRRINRANGTLDLIVGTGVRGDGPDGAALDCRLARPHGVFIDPRDRALYIGDSENHRVRVMRE